MRKYNQKEKKKLVLWIIFLLTIGLGLGYALLTEQLKLNGSVNYGSMAWDVGFTTAEDGGGSITSSPSVSTDKKSVTVSCNVGTSTASETCIAKAKIKNASSFAVQLESNPTITFDNTYINSVDAVWTEDNSPITALNSISAGVEKEIQITITTKELTEDMLPETSLNIPVTITMDWVEIDDITSDDINEPSTSNILITNDDFTYGAYLNGNGSKNTSGAFGMLKTTDEMFRVQDITIEVIDTDVSNYIVVIEIYNEEGAYLGNFGANIPLVEGSKTYTLEDFINKSAESYYFRVNIGIYNGAYTKVPETANITVYKGENNSDSSETTGGSTNESTSASDVNRHLITNDDFTYGAYLNGNGSKNTSGAFGMLKTTDEMFRVQDITIEVIDTDVSNYIVVIEIYNEEGAYLGNFGANIPLVEGSKTYTLEDFINKSAESYYFRVNIGILNNGSYTKVPETAIINVYATSSVMEGKNIYMIGDSITYGAYLDDISTESYPKVLEQLTGSNVTVNAQSGIKLVGGITSKVANMTGSADLITIFGGTNDYWQGGISIGTYGTSDTTTFYGALQNILDNLESKYPDAEYLFIFPPEQKFNGATSGDKGYGSLDDFRSAFIDFCTRNNLKYIDLKTVSEFDYSKHTTDGVHPNKEGHIIIANAIFNFIQKNY